MKNENRQRQQRKYQVNFETFTFGAASRCASVVN